MCMLQDHSITSYHSTIFALMASCNLPPQQHTGWYLICIATSTVWQSLFEAKGSFADSGIDNRQEDTSACSSSQGDDVEVCKCSVPVQCCNNLVGRLCSVCRMQVNVI